MAEEQSNDNYQNSENQKEWYQHGWGLLFAILLFPFFLIWYAWAKSSWNKNTKIVVTVVCAIFLIFAMSIDSDYEPSDSSTAENGQEEQEGESGEDAEEEPEEEPYAWETEEGTSYRLMEEAVVDALGETNEEGDKTFESAEEERDQLFVYFRSNDPSTLGREQNELNAEVGKILAAIKEDKELLNEFRSFVISVRLDPDRGTYLTIAIESDRIEKTNWDRFDTDNLSMITHAYRPHDSLR